MAKFQKIEREDPNVTDEFPDSGIRAPLMEQVLSSATIEKWLVDAENDLEAMTRNREHTSLEALAGIDGAEERLRELNEAFEDLRVNRVERLRAALPAARELEAQQELLKRDTLQRSQYKAVVAHLAARDKAAALMAAAIEEACNQYKSVLERSAKAQNACPLGMKWPSGSYCSVVDIRKLVALELYRHGGNPSLSGSKTFPGGVADILYRGQPEAIAPIVGTIHAASQSTLTLLSGGAKLGGKAQG